ncbi:MAG TPA: polysaccharide biosynthesis tyrosine autokinase [Bryobacteraceae bacterium]|jgi:capsular exopolysaccharide synthesis family protein
MKQIEGGSSELAGSRRLPRYAPPQPHPEFEITYPSASPMHYLLVVSRQKWKIISVVAACILATYLVCSRLTPIYEATAKVDVDRRVPVGVVGQEATQGAVTGDDADAFMATQAELIQSDAVLRPVAEHLHLRELERQLAELGPDGARKKSDAPVYLKQLKVKRPINTYILDISYRSRDPQLAANVANAIAQSYLEHTFDIRVRSSSALATFMERQLDELRAKMERSNLALAKFEQELNVINPEQKTDILSSRLLQLNTEYTNAQADRVRKEAAHNAMQSGTVAAAELSTQGEELNKLHERVNQAKQRLANVASIYGPAHQEYRKASNDLSEVQRQFDEMRQNVAQRVETDYREAVNREQMLQKTLAQTKAEYDQLNAHSFEYQQLKREADADKALYSDLERRIREAGINAGFQNSSIRIADLARPPDLPVFPRKGLSLILAFILSSVVAICGAILADVLDDSIRDPEQGARALNTSVVGILPAVKEMRRAVSVVPPPALAATTVESCASLMNGLGLVKYEYPRSDQPQKRAKSGRKSQPAEFQGVSSYEEAIRALRHSILLPDFDRDVKSILITSAEPGAGKSTALIHLAIAHAEQGLKTLIIDADLRRPMIYKKLGLNGTLGLSNVLLGELGWKEGIVRIEHWPQLDALPAGTASRRASDLVGPMMIDILDEAAKEYDMVFVDAPPLLGFAEAMQVASAVDGVIVMARAGTTRRSAVAAVLATLNRLRAPVIGLVLNEMDKRSTNGYYYYNDYKKYYAEARREA